MGIGRVSGVLLLALLALVATAAQAVERPAATLAIASIGQGGSGGTLEHRLTTRGSWPSSLLANGGEMSIHLDTDGDAAIERRVTLRYAQGRLRGVVTSASGRTVGSATATRTGPRTVVVRFSRALLSGVGGYRWFAFTGFKCRHRYASCGDTEPARGRWLTHRLAPSAPSPAPIAGDGYDLVFADEFDTFDASVWTRGIWYEGAPPQSSIFVRDSILSLVSRRSQEFPNVTVTTLPSRSFRHGYFEARMRWTKGNGSWPAFWLLSTNHARGGPRLSGEIDVFEGQGREPNVSYGTIHRNSCGCKGVDNRQNENNHKRHSFDLTDRWHVYGARWTASEVTWYLDGRELMSAPVFDSTDQDMFLLLDMWTGGWTGGTDDSTPAELKTEVDWVRVWQR